MDKVKIIVYYLIFLIGMILEIVFLFEIPYYRYSFFLKYLKIIRILLGFLIFLIDAYFRVVSITETRLQIARRMKKDKYFADKNFFYLIDKILIIIGFGISCICLVLNIIGVVLSSKEISSDNSTHLQNIYSRCSLILLFENILLTIAWIYFTIYWIFYIYYNIVKSNPEENSENHNNENNTDINNLGENCRDIYTNQVEGVVAPPPPPPGFGEGGRSSGREISNNQDDDNKIQ